MTNDPIDEARRVLEAYGFEMHPTIKRAFENLLSHVERPTAPVDAEVERLAERLDNLTSMSGVWGNDLADAAAMLRSLAAERDDLREELRILTCSDEEILADVLPEDIEATKEIVERALADARRHIALTSQVTDAEVAGLLERGGYTSQLSPDLLHRLITDALTMVQKIWYQQTAPVTGDRAEFEKRLEAMKRDPNTPLRHQILATDTLALLEAADRREMALAEAIAEIIGRVKMADEHDASQSGTRCFKERMLTKEAKSMTTLRERLWKSASSLEDTAIDPALLSYFHSMAQNEAHDLVLTLFLAAADREGVNKAFLARRMDKSPEQVTRWLGGSGNWTLETLTNLLVALGYKPKFSAERLSAMRQDNEHHDLAHPAIVVNVTSSDSSSEAKSLKLLADHGDGVLTGAV
jgi:hypothetical protein